MTDLLRAELMRLWADRIRLGFIVLVLCTTSALMSSHAHGIDPGAHQRVLQLVALGAAFSGAGRYLTSRGAGEVARMVLLAHRTPVLGVKAISAAVVGASIGAAATVGASFSTLDLALPWAPVFSAAWAVLGMLIGVVARSIVLGSVAIVAVQFGSLVVLDMRPLGAVMLAALLVVLGAVAWVVMIRRDVV